MGDIGDSGSDMMLKHKLLIIWLSCLCAIFRLTLNTAMSFLAASRDCLLVAFTSFGPAYGYQMPKIPLTLHSHTQELPASPPWFFLSMIYLIMLERTSPLLFALDISKSKIYHTSHSSHLITSISTVAKTLLQINRQMENKRWAFCLLKDL